VIDMLRPFIALVVFSLVMASANAEPVKWQHVGWGGGGFYWSCVFDPHTDGTIYMGGDVAGVYKSTDHGKNWVLSNSGIAAYEVLSMAVDPSTPGSVYAVTANGISRSTDSCATWETLPKSGQDGLKLVGVKGKTVRALAVDPSDSKRLYFAAPDGRVLGSADTGRSWQVLHTVAGGSAAAAAVSPKDPTRAWVATSRGILLLTDHGRKVSQVLPGTATSIAAASDGTRLYAALGKTGVARSDDAGQTWTPVRSGLPATDEVIDVVVDPANADAAYCIAASGWGGAFYYTSDGGKTWTKVDAILADKVNDPTGHDDTDGSGRINLSNPRNLAINPLNGNELLIAGNWRPVWSGDAGRTWEERSRGADISCVMDVQFDAGNTYVAVMDEGLVMSPDNGATWRQFFPRRWNRDQSGHAWRVQVWNQGQEILATSSPWDVAINQTMRSNDGGKTFVGVRDGLPNYLPTANTMWGRAYPRAIASHPSNRFRVYMGMDGDADGKGEGGGLFVSSDGGWHWQRSPGQPGAKRIFFALAVDPTDAKRIYWGACGEGGGLWRSDDAGATWKHVFKQDAWVFNVAVGPDGTVWCPGKQMWRSDDHGETWKQLTHLPETVIVAVEPDPTDAKRAWFATNNWSSAAVGGIYETTDGGATWTQITGDVPYTKPMVLRYNPATRDLWAAGVGIFRTRR
jgi:photosystem II stability/assembly factor-like uncharacterized protein